MFTQGLSEPSWGASSPDEEAPLLSNQHAGDNTLHTLNSSRVCCVFSPPSLGTHRDSHGNAGCLVGFCLFLLGWADRSVLAKQAFVLIG